MEVDKQIDVAKSSVDGFELPCGYLDPQGTLHTAVEVQGMNGNDEETLAAKGMPVIRKLNRILSRCTTAIGDIRGSAAIEAVIPDLTQGDRLYLLFAIRRVSLGNEFPFDAECPHCETSNKVTADLSELETKAMADPKLRVYQITLERSKKVISMKVLTGRGEEAISKAQASGKDLVSNAMLARIDAIAGRPAKIDDLKNLELADRNQIRDAWSDREGGVDTEIEVQCSQCEREFKTDVDMGSPGFFNPLGNIEELENQVKACLEYWRMSYSEVMGMPSDRRIRLVYWKHDLETARAKGREQL